MIAALPVTSPFWLIFGLMTVIQFFVAFIIFVLQIRQKRYRTLVLPGLLMLVCFLLFQQVSSNITGEVISTAAKTALRIFSGIPVWVLGGIFVLLCLGEIFAFRSFAKYEKNQITPSSVKEAIDSLPTGLCFFLINGRVLMKNKAVDRFCMRMTGAVLQNGKVFYEQLKSGQITPGFQSIGTGDQIVIADEGSSAWSVQQKDTVYDKRPATMLIIADISEIWQKTRQLQLLMEKLSEVNRNLVKINKEIVEVTAAQEILNARLKIHDELGSNLLLIRKYLSNGGSDEEMKTIREKLQMNVAFLKNGYEPVTNDDYTLLFETARKLGVDVEVYGTLPESDIRKAVLSTAIHECLTNTIRHAKGDRLYIHLSEQEEFLTAVFTNNGKQPEAEIRETGGLHSLRGLVENAGGQMHIQSQPEMRVTIIIPKEETDGLQSTDRR